MSARSTGKEIIYLNVGGARYATTLETLLTESSSLLFEWFENGPPPLIKEEPTPGGFGRAFFIDRDPHTFGIILNYLRLRGHGQLWETCLPKDPDRLALLTQEAEYFRLPILRDGAISLLQTCTEKADQDYFNHVMVESKSCPMGLSQILATADANSNKTDSSKLSLP